MECTYKDGWKNIKKLINFSYKVLFFGYFFLNMPNSFGSCVASFGVLIALAVFPFFWDHWFPSWFE